MPQNKAKKIIIINSKGGCGKSTIAHYILPFYFIDEQKKSSDKKTKNSILPDNLTIYEFEASNKHRKEAYEKSNVSYVYDDLTNPEVTEGHFTDICFDDTNTIIDVGGGSDALVVLKNLSDVAGGLSDFVVIFPFFLTEDSYQGAVDMYQSLRVTNPEVKPLFVVNKMTYRYDVAFKPHVVWLKQEDVFYEMEKYNLDTKRFKDGKEKNSLSYVPEMVEALPNILFSIRGSSLDFCENLLNGMSTSEQQKKLFEDIKETGSSIEKQKEMYKEGARELGRKSDLFNLKHYCKPLFDAITKTLK